MIRVTSTCLSIVEVFIEVTDRTFLVELAISNRIDFSKFITAVSGQLYSLRSLYTCILVQVTLYLVLIRL